MQSIPGAFAGAPRHPFKVSVEADVTFEIV
jgi:hypothetical protein